MCNSKYGGMLLGQPVVVVASGEGPLNAALCLTELLRCSAYIKVRSCTLGVLTALARR